MDVDLASSVGRFSLPTMTARYDRIGVTYTNTRKADPRIARVILDALGDAESVVNIGAGTGSYEPLDRVVTAVEPSREMIARRPKDAAPAICASAESLPFADDSFDAAMAVLTVHHWSDPAKGMEELKRVARKRIVILTFDPAIRPWLTDYLPELAGLDEERMPAIGGYADWLGQVEIKPVPIPHDCEDGFLYAYWRRPEAYFKEQVRAGSSSFWAISEASDGLQRLEDDLKSGEWERRYYDLLDQDSYDAGYRLVTAEL